MGEIADALRRSEAGQPREREARHLAPPDPHFDRSREQALPAAPGAQPLRPRDPAILAENSPQLEACRQVALRLRSELLRHQARSVAVVSALRDEGKTTSSCNLAIALASLDSERRVAIVGLDLRKPCLARVLGIDVKVGIEQVLAGRASLDDARVSFEEPAFDVYAAIQPQRAAHEILTKRRLSGLITALEQRYETVIIDTPPVLLVPDTRLILERVPVCVPVARAGLSRVRSFREMIDALPPGQVLSTVLNGARRSSHYYEGYHYAADLDPAEDHAEHVPEEEAR